MRVGSLCWLSLTVLSFVYAGCIAMGTEEDKAECITGQKECGAGQVCIEFRCFSICETTSQCDSSFICVDEVCHPDGRFCEEHANCAPDDFCKNGTCIGKYTLGSPCSSIVECLTGFCTDDVCCDSRCTTDCYSCLAANSEDSEDGTCSPVTKGLDDNHDCPGDLACNGLGRCYGKGLSEVCEQNFECVSNNCKAGECHASGCGDSAVNSNEECDDGNSDNTDTCTNACRNAACGDTYVQGGVEECDHGLNNSDSEPDACRTNCTWAFCGDGVVDTGEVCDQGMNNSSDYHLEKVCNSSCTAFSSYCGDEIVDAVEECDYGEQNSDLEANSCRMNCRMWFCGDGVVDVNEECDEGLQNTNSGVGCNLECMVPGCGNGVVEANEPCDSGVFNSDTNPNACRLDCTDSRCGDGVVDSGEICDDGDANVDGYSLELLRCNSDCSGMRPACGDGVVQHDEVCDDGDREANSNGNGCSSACTRMGSCGDGVVQTCFEACDDGFNDECGSCNSTCSENGLGATCGDGDTCAEFEECDDGNNITESECDYGNPTCLLCSAECREELPLTGPYCGDGQRLLAREACDNEASCSDDCAKATRVYLGGRIACYLSFDGTYLHCWAASSFAPHDISVPSELESALVEDPIKDFSLGSSHACALQESDRLTCWGGEDSGTSVVPPHVMELRVNGGLRFVSGGGDSTCVVGNNNEIRCWGTQMAQWDIPIPEISNNEIREIAGGDAHFCVLYSDHTLRCWGNNAFAQAVNPDPPRLFQTVRTGPHVSCGIDFDSDLVCWGRDALSRSGSGGTVVSDVAIGAYHSCGISEETVVFCWGDGSTDTSCAPPWERECGQSMASGGLFNSVSTAHVTSCAVDLRGFVSCWGMWYDPVDSTGSQSYRPFTIPPHLQPPEIELPPLHGP